MSIIGWIILGLIAGFIASKIVNRTGEGLAVDILLGIGGAVVGGGLFHSFGMQGVNGVNLYSFIVATIGAIVVLVVYHALIRASRFRRI
ncbi:MAG: GlsB/YeaQ/YmgE family stress response membrane protein [Steroidobacteraceae bacterium]